MINNLPLNSPVIQKKKNRSRRPSHTNAENNTRSSFVMNNNH